MAMENNSEVESVSSKTSDREDLLGIAKRKRIRSTRLNESYPVTVDREALTASNLKGTG